ncbi:alpha/beta hydrolase [Embleya sp. NBC_00888]|uniref:alpha/beta fold hydrolase n=1 Tax=Embleya sp. NBC_00888 TaxID=2975960 RepID=UPI00386EE3B5|nr:alpha/beta hydrolase [Embleya sp. NBC_00888]
MLLYGDSERALVHQPGTPSSPAPDKLLADVADHHGLRVVLPLRPGYGNSTPNPGRRIADVPADIEAVIQHLGVTEFVSAGYSGGGGHSLATAALTPSCKAAAAVATPAPRDAEGLDYYAGMVQSNHEEWALADKGEDAVRRFLEKFAASRRERPVEAFVEVFDDAIPPVDRDVMTHESAERLNIGWNKGLENGIEGWLEDDIALTTPWGFDLPSVTTPVTFWAGRLDVFVPPDHTVWMARQLPSSDLHLLAAHGHISLQRALMHDIVADLVTKAGW